MAYFDDVLVLQLTQVLHLAYGGHVESVFELPDFNLLDSNLLSCGYLSA
jgi:hypothetical protein